MIIQHADHAAAGALLAQRLNAGNRLAFAPQVLAESLYVVTDPRRFTRPLEMTIAWHIALEWWMGHEIEKKVFPDTESPRLFLAWMEQYRLGRERLGDRSLRRLTKAEASFPS